MLSIAGTDRGVSNLMYATNQKQRVAVAVAVVAAALFVALFGQYIQRVSERKAFAKSVAGRCGLSWSQYSRERGLAAQAVGMRYELLLRPKIRLAELIGPEFLYAIDKVSVSYDMPAAEQARLRLLVAKLRDQPKIEHYHDCKHQLGIALPQVAATSTTKP